MAIWFHFRLCATWLVWDVGGIWAFQLTQLETNRYRPRRQCSWRDELPPLWWGLGYWPQQIPGQLGAQQGHFPLQRARSSSWTRKTNSLTCPPLPHKAAKAEEGKSRELDLEELITPSFLRAIWTQPLRPGMALEPHAGGWGPLKGSPAVPKDQAGHKSSLDKEAWTVGFPCYNYKEAARKWLRTATYYLLRRKHSWRQEGEHQVTGSIF